MGKKTMLLALTVVSAALFAVPGMAAATEIHLEPGTGTTFTGTGEGGNLRAAGEPTITCEKTQHASGELTSNTTATLVLDFTECHIIVTGVTLKCKTAGAVVPNTITTTNVAHLITIDTINKPGVLVTPPFPTIICGSGLSERKIQVDGNGVIGTITSPSCGASSATLTVNFGVKEEKQEHMLFTGTKYDLSVTTEPSTTQVTAALEGEATLTAAKVLKLNCT